MKNPSSILVLFVAFSSFCATSLYAQDAGTVKQAFVRIYNLEGKKITKGRVAGVSDTKITLLRNKVTEEIDIREIGFIRTRHSLGHNVLIGSVAGSALFSTIFAAEADPDLPLFGYSASEGVLAGLILGAPIGAGIGALTTLFKEQKRYEIDGEKNQWLRIKDGLLRKI